MRLQTEAIRGGSRSIPGRWIGTMGGSGELPIRETGDGCFRVQSHFTNYRLTRLMQLFWLLPVGVLVGGLGATAAVASVAMPVLMIALALFADHAGQCFARRVDVRVEPDGTLTVERAKVANILGFWGRTDYSRGVKEPEIHLRSGVEENLAWLASVRNGHAAFLLVGEFSMLVAFHSDSDLVLAELAREPICRIRTSGTLDD